MMGFRHRRASRLFATYAAASLVPVVALGGMLVKAFHDQGVERGHSYGRSQAAVVVSTAIAPSLSGADLSAGLTTQERSRLRTATDLAIFDGSVARLRLRSFDGKVVFSDDGTSRGAVPPTDPAFKKVAAGGTDVQVVEDERQASGRTVRVLQPVVAAASGQSTGVLEIYLPYEEIHRTVAIETRRTVLLLAGGLILLYAVLALISWWTTQALRRHADEHEHQALHDPLTNLPNRELFRRLLEQALRGGRRGDRGAVVLVDLDHFKEVNDTLGHHAGDELLRVVAQRLTASVRTDDAVARLGGDEFGLVLYGAVDRDATIALLSRVRRELAHPVVLDSVSVSVDASFGVCFFPEHSEGGTEAVLKRADAAMYQGKHGPVGVVVYEPTTSPETTQYLVLQQELRAALERDELRLHYQPKVHLASGAVRGVEALVRWQHPQRGLVPPMEFLPVAERGELIGPLTIWVLRRALQDHAAWAAQGLRWTVAVNVSMRNLTSMTFVRTVTGLLDQYGVPAGQLHLEVTETALAFDSDTAAVVVAALAAEGISISVDDFGTGYTSLSQLRTSAVSEIKIDRTFVSGLEGNDQDRAIVRSVIGLGHSLGCVVTAEGVETEPVAQWLRDAGCDLAQGYLWMRPAPWPEVAARLRDLPTRAGLAQRGAR